MEQDIGFDRLKLNERVIRGINGANEDTTRMRAIDTVLFDVLGWDRLDIETERYVRAEGYADYAFLQSESISLVLEAKKSGDSFVVPSKKLSSSPVGFGLLESESPSAGKALRQATGYAASIGARFVAISNGHQWILALTFVAKQPIEERSVFVFESVDAVFERFSLFWNCFGPEGVNGNVVSGQLLESRKAAAPAKLSTRIPNFPVAADRNRLLNTLEVVVGLVWDEMNSDEREDEFLRACYVRPTATEDSITEAKEILLQRFQTDESATRSADDVRTVPSLVESYLPEKPIIILGRIGHGKSTFLRYLRLVESPDVLQKYIQIDIDFLDTPAAAEDVAAFVYQQVDQQLLSRYEIDVEEAGVERAALRAELQRFRKSSEGQLYANDESKLRVREVEKINEWKADKHSYLAKVLYHLKQGRGNSIALFFDNLDRRTDPIQEEAFLRASAIARDWSCLVFVCLRPGTLYRSRGDGVLDSVAPRTLTVTPPGTAVLLKKRLTYAARLAEGENVTEGRRGPLSSGVTLQLPATAKFLRCCSESFFRNKKLAHLFDSVSNGDVRSLLRFVRDVLTSQHLDTEKILRKIDAGGYQIAPHEALRAMLYRDSMHFDPNASVFINLFDSVRADLTEHFSRPLALKYLSDQPQGSPTFGFCTRSALIQYLCQLGFSNDHASETVSFLYAKKCCEGRTPGVPWSESGDEIRATSLGRYHVSDLICSFNYFDAMTVDTPIMDDSVRSEIQDVFPIRSRLTRASKFVGYLRASVGTIQDAEAVRFLQSAFDSVTREIDEVQASI